MDQIKKEEIISKILKMELEITSAVLSGHKATDGDEFHEKRIELKVLRKLLFEN
jgi:hypothetical protein